MQRIVIRQLHPPLLSSLQPLSQPQPPPNNPPRLKQPPLLPPQPPQRNSNKKIQINGLHPPELETPLHPQPLSQPQPPPQLVAAKSLIFIPPRRYIH